MTIEPFLKWAGNKRQLVQKHPELFPAPETVERLVLPFCGSGAVAFLYPGKPMLLSDTNPHLMCTLKAVRDDVEGVIGLLEREERYYSQDRYHYNLGLLEKARLPSLFAAPEVLRWVAVSTFVVSFWGYNGLCRTNRKGMLNVPFGRTASGKAPRLVDPEQLRACSAALARAKFATREFERAVRESKPGPGDFVYFDPPFLGTFSGYGPAAFGEADHVRLAEQLPGLDVSGARWSLSNSYTEKTWGLFASGKPWHVARVPRGGAINSKASARGKVWELFVRNYQ